LQNTKESTVDDAESKAAEVIARNIEQLEGAVDFAAGKMDAALFEATCEVLRDKVQELGWESEFGNGFDDEPWLAPQEWRAIGEDVGGDYYLYCHLDLDGDESNTWLAFFSGVAGRRVYLGVATKTVSGRRNKRRLANEIEDDLKVVLDSGFLFDIEEFVIRVPVNLDRQKIVDGFRDDDLSEALKPLSLALDKINQVRQNLDRIAVKIKEFVA
jgi:hypothetical protein